MQQGHKGPRPSAATRQQENKGPTRQTADMSEEGEDNHERHRRVELKTKIAPGKRRNAQDDPIWDSQKENRKTSSQNFPQVTKNDELNIVEGSAPCEAGKETALA
jgi:hypothetical protein